MEAWIHAGETVDSFTSANAAHDRFSGEWSEMSDDEKLRWLLAAASNSQVRNEGFKAGPFYTKIKKPPASVLHLSRRHKGCALRSLVRIVEEQWRHPL